MAEQLKTLIVEDSEDDCLLMVDELRQQGFDPQWERVQTASAMKESLEQRDWNCVLSDFKMPRFDAPTALRLLQESGRDLPFIVISGTIGEETAVETMRAGAHDYLMKGSLQRLAHALAIIVTPHRFRTKRQLWSYAGLGVVMRTSSDWVREEDQWVRSQVSTPRGLNNRSHRQLKSVFKGAATSVIGQKIDSPLGKYYSRLLADGTKPNLAKLSLARKIAAVFLALWKKEEAYDPSMS